MITVLFSCSKDEYEEMGSGEVATRAVSNTLFTNVSVADFRYGYSKEYVEQFYMSGKIHCQSPSTYEFILGTNGSDTQYEVSVGTNYFRRGGISGGNIQNVTVQLPEGDNICFVSIYSSINFAKGEVRLVIDKINGKRISKEEGYADLSLGGIFSVPDYPIGGGIVHKVCSNSACNFPNSPSVENCVVCGTKL